MKAKVETREGASGFVCTKCKKWHAFGAYVMAHCHIELTHTCGCGARHTVLDLKVERQEEDRSHAR